MLCPYCQSPLGDGARMCGRCERSVPQTALSVVASPRVTIHQTPPEWMTPDLDALDELDRQDREASNRLDDDDEPPPRLASRRWIGWTTWGLLAITAYFLFRSMSVWFN